MAVKTERPVSIKVCLRYQNQGNYVYFDNVCLVKDNAQSYTYDKDGNNNILYYYEYDAMNQLTYCMIMKTPKFTATHTIQAET